MKLKKPRVLTIAGLDPSGCAGLLADIKTFEANGAYGMAVCTANTEQTVTQFNQPNWIPKEKIASQLKALQDDCNFEYAKIGLVESFEILNALIDLLIDKNPDVKIVWDPVCKATASFQFHHKANKVLLEEICRKVYLVTPNIEEMAVLLPKLSATEGAKYLSQFCHVLLKGGHGSGEYATDILYSNQHVEQFEGERFKNYSKRGTGCVLSAAIAAKLSNGIDLDEACREAKDYVAKFICSSETLVGFHKYGNKQVAVYN
jgi:hydroxymethylpyrimidine/phosphomethylpyrimidine kinase